MQHSTGMKFTSDKVHHRYRYQMAHILLVLHEMFEAVEPSKSHTVII